MSNKKIDRLINDKHNEILGLKSRIYDCQITLALLEEELQKAQKELMQLKADPRNLD